MPILLLSCGPVQTNFGSSNGSSSSQSSNSEKVRISQISPPPIHQNPHHRPSIHCQPKHCCLFSNLKTGYFGQVMTSNLQFSPRNMAVFRQSLGRCSWGFVLPLYPNLAVVGCSLKFQRILTTNFSDYHLKLFPVMCYIFKVRFIVFNRMVSISAWKSLLGLV